MVLALLWRCYGAAFGPQGEQLNLNAASRTGAQAQALAGRLIRSGDQDLMVVVGAEP